MKNEKDIQNSEIIDSYDYLGSTASVTECTGLIPTPALSKEERESYEQIKHIFPATSYSIKKKGKNNK